MSDARVTLRVVDGVGVVQMDDGKVNAMQREFLEDFGAALDRALAENVTAVVLAGRHGCFSAGLDIKTLPTLEGKELRAVLQLFTDTMLRVFMFERPVVAAISGHAIAGGCVLALAADRRIATQERFRIGLNEVPLGINLPRLVVEFARLALPAHRLGAAVVSGELSEGEAAQTHGWVEALVPAEELLQQAVELAKRIGRSSTAAYTHAKKLTRVDAEQRSRAAMAEELDGFAGGFGKF